MTAQEEYELLELGFTEEEIKAIAEAERTAKKDIRAEK